MSAKGKESQKKLFAQIKKCPRIAYFGRRFCSLEWNLLAGMAPLKSGGYRVVGKRRVRALEYLKSLDITPGALSEIYTDSQLEQGKIEPYELTWESLVKRCRILIDDTDAWVKLAKLLNQGIVVYCGIPPNSYDEFEPMYEVLPSGRVERLGGA